MALPGYAAWRFSTHYTAPPSACAKEIQGDFRARKGFRDREIGMRGRGELKIADRGSSRIEFKAAI